MPRTSLWVAVVALGFAFGLVGCGSPPAADSAIEPIGRVQGAGGQSPFEGREVLVEGVVTLAWSDGSGAGFVQALVPDADPATSEALFVVPARDQPALSVGQRVRATGTVGESGEGAALTTLLNARVEPLGEAPLPAPVLLAALPVDAAGWEALEAMRVRIDAPLTVAGNDGLGRFGEVVLAAGGRLFTPTEVALPGEAARHQQATNSARTLTLDDASSVENPQRIGWLPQPVSNAAPLRAGSTLEGIEGVVDPRFGGWRLQATAPVARITQAPRPPAPPLRGELRLAGMNLLNLFNGDGEGGGFPTERGARTHPAYQRQLAKHVATITALDPNVIAAQEMENDGYGPQSAVQELADALNAAQPGARWTPVQPDRAPGSDRISVAILYRADQVTPVGAAALDTAGPFRWGSRPPLAQTFRVGESPLVTVVSLHFKSKGGCEDAQGADADQHDGQGCFNALRQASVQALREWIDRDPTATGSTRVALVGDFNAYAQEDPLRDLLGRGWIDPWATTAGSYSFVFRGQAGRLDHALLSPALAAALTGAAKWHSNSDESPQFAYDGALGRSGEATPWRSSDHDPLVLGFAFE